MPYTGTVTAQSCESQVIDEESVQFLHLPSGFRITTAHHAAHAAHALMDKKKNCQRVTEHWQAVTFCHKRTCLFSITLPPSPTTALRHCQMHRLKSYRFQQHNRTPTGPALSEVLEIRGPWNFFYLPKSREWLGSGGFTSCSGHNPPTWVCQHFSIWTKQPFQRGCIPSLLNQNVEYSFLL